MKFVAITLLALLATSTQAQHTLKFSDGSLLKATILDKAIVVKTAYGNLSIPTNEVTRIEYASRISQSEMTAIENCLLDLYSEQASIVEAAEATLISHTWKSQIIIAKKIARNNIVLSGRVITDSGPIVQMLAKLKLHVSENDLRAFEMDIVHTSKMKVSGTIETPKISINTSQFGQLMATVSDLRTIEIFGRDSVDITDSNVQADPGTLAMVQGEKGTVLYIRVTGTTNGLIYGDEVYTADSPIAHAAVHSGLVRLGEQAVLKLTIQGVVPGFTAAAKNGTSSSAYGAYRGYSLAKARK